MVKCQYDWNSYVKDFEPYELEEYYCVIPLMEVFALEFDFSPRKEAKISGKITIMDYPVVHTIFSTSSDGFLLMNSGKFTEVSGETELPISAIGPVDIKLDLVDKSYGNLELERNFGDEKIGKEEEEEEGKEEEEDSEPIRLAKALYEKEMCVAGETGLFQSEVMTAAEIAEVRKISDLWNCNDVFYMSTDKLLRKKLTTPCCSLEVMYAVYEDARAVSVEVTFADWNPSYFTGSSRGKRTSRGANTFCQPDHYIDMSNGMHVFGQVTARNTLLTHPDATTTLFGKTIDEVFIIKLGDLIPFSKTFVVFPRKSSLLLDIDLRYVPDLRHVPRNAPLSGHKVPPSEWFVKTTLEITNQHCSYYRFVVKDSGPAKLFVDVTWSELSIGMFLT